MKSLPTKISVITAAAIFAACTVNMRTANADIASVKYVHQYVTKTWDITIPARAADSNVVNMKYLMSLVDKANEELNGAPTTDYAADPARATSNIVSTTAARDAIDKLIQKNKINGGTFWYVTENDYAEMSFDVRGTFQIDYGDGTIETCNQQEWCEFFHEYTDNKERHTVTLTGNAEEYTSNSTIYIDSDHVEIGGCLGCIFHTLDDGSQPNFSASFHGSMISEIPGGLFDGIYGVGRESMFSETFRDCPNLTTIGDELFSGITDGAEYMFRRTFYNCAKLTTIGNGMFKNLTTGAYQMFNLTFLGSGITHIPEDTFASLTTGAESMFELTFAYCEDLKTAPIFPKLKTGAPWMFGDTFVDSGIETIPDGMFAALTTGAEGMLSGTFTGTPRLKTIGKDVFASLTTGARGMFANAFHDSGITHVQDNMFPVLTTGARGMFESAFADCENLQSVGNFMPMISDTTYPDEMFATTFAGNISMTNTLKVGPKNLELWEMWPDVDYPQGTYSGAENIPGYADIPETWK